MVFLNLRKQKWMIFAIYRPPKQKLKNFLDALSSSIDFYSRIYENILVIGDFNAEPQSLDIGNFMINHEFYNHMKTKTCWKSPKGTCIDLVLSNRKFSLKNTGAVETHLSDHHLLIYTVLKVNFTKLAPKKYVYRDYKNFDNKTFCNVLKTKLIDTICNYESFESIFTEVLNKFAPLKTKILRANNKPHMSKMLRKAMMNRSRLRSKAYKTGLPDDMANYRKQRNLVVNLNKKCKKSFFNSPKSNAGSKGFWKIYKPFFSDKGGAAGERILLVNNCDIISNDRNVATVFNEHFSSLFLALLTQFLVLSKNSHCHPSIVTIKSRENVTGFFEFRSVSYADVFHEILKMNSAKKTSGNISIKALKIAVRESASVLMNCFNNSIHSGSFPNDFKLAEVIPVHKKNETTDKSNYRPISILPSVSKIFEKLIYKQLHQFIESKFSKFLCGFRKGYSTQHSLINLILNWQKCLAKSDKIGAVLMDLSKAYDCLPHDLLNRKVGCLWTELSQLEVFT